ncbi:MAG: hypothetical protein IK997_07715 [Bacilli bacterium]|nr:hypothetical protein [Bacilli bacterium]
MEKVLKKGLCLIAIYVIAIVLVFLMSERITRLDRGTGQDFRNTNGSVSVTLEK